MSPSALCRLDRASVGASVNLSLGTDGQFGPLDLANERVMPGGVRYKDIGEVAPPPPPPPSCLAAGEHNPLGYFLQLISPFTSFVFRLFPLKL